MSNITETPEFRENRQFVRDMIPIFRGSMERGEMTWEEVVAATKGLRRQFQFNRNGQAERVRPVEPMVPSIETIRAYEAARNRQEWDEVHRQIARRRRHW